MRTSDVDILVVPGWSGSGPDHWQSRWEQKLSTARRVEQADWHKPDRAEWAARIVAEIRASVRPVVLVAHSAGVSSVGHAAESLGQGEVAGAFLVAPASERAKRAIPGMPADFTRHWRGKLPFPTVLVASTDDPYCPYEEAEALAGHWGADLVSAGASGHINAASGHGPWPEGLMRFAGFLKRLG